jgi:CRISPR/Cas system-associated protein Csx1
MKKVIIEKERLRKCVILEKDGEYVFRSGYGEFHEEVAENFRELEPELNDWRIRGGGRVIWNDTYGIRVYGYSVDYGHMDQEIVEELVSEFAKENGVEFTNDTGVGY